MKKFFDYPHCSANCILSISDTLKQNRNFQKNLCEFVSIRGFLMGAGNMANIVFSMLLRFDGNQEKNCEKQKDA